MNVVRMKVELREIVVDEPLGGVGKEHALPAFFPVATTFWIYRVGGNRSRRWSLDKPKAPARIDAAGPLSGATGTSTSRPSVTSGQEQPA